jgi:hypothetical protein
MQHPMMPSTARSLERASSTRISVEQSGDGVLVVLTVIPMAAAFQALVSTLEHAGMLI